MTTHTGANIDSSSAEEARRRFDTEQAAEKYASSLNGTATHRRELRCIRRGLKDVPAGARVLDLPCGTGRLLPELLNMGFTVVGGDFSPHMIDQAREFVTRQGLPVDRVELHVADALHTVFEDQSFDAVVCNRLLHHFREADTRRAALKELSRISRGPIVASFFCNLAWDAVVFHTRNALSRDKATDRIPIRLREMIDDAEAVGLTVKRVLPTRPGISKQWYLVLERKA